LYFLKLSTELSSSEVGLVLDSKMRDGTPPILPYPASTTKLYL